MELEIIKILLLFFTGAFCQGDGNSQNIPVKIILPHNLHPGVTLQDISSAKNQSDHSKCDCQFYPKPGCSALTMKCTCKCSSPAGSHWLTTMSHEGTTSPRVATSPRGGVSQSPLDCNEKEKTSVVCASQNQGGATISSHLLSDHDSSKPVEICGNWISYQCRGENIRAFNVTFPIYAKVVSQCKNDGAEVAQPADEKLSASSSPFQSGDQLFRNYRPDQSGNWMLSPTTAVSTCQRLGNGTSSNVGTTTPTPVPVTATVPIPVFTPPPFTCDKQDKTSVACGKPNPNSNVPNGLAKAQADVSFLYNYSSKMEICGNWVKYECTEGTVKAFNLSSEKYSELLQECKANGSDVTQPADNIETISWNPFQVGDTLTENYRKDEKGNWTLLKAEPVADCLPKDKSTDIIGTTFYATFLPDRHDRPGTNQIMVGTDSPTNIAVNITWKQGVPGAQNQTVIINNTAVRQIILPDYLHSEAIKMTSHTEFVAYTMHVAKFSSDGTCLFPDDVLGTDYTVLTGYSNNTEYQIRENLKEAFGASYVFIVLTAEGTKVTVFFPNSTQQTYSGNDMDVVKLRYHYDPSGTKINSTKPVAVFAGQECLYVPGGCEGCDLVYEMLTPTDTHGIHFALTPFFHNVTSGQPDCDCLNATYCVAQYEFFKVLALYDNTTITRFGTVSNETFTLNHNEWRYVLPLAYEYSYLYSDKPIIAVHLMNSGAYSNEEGRVDPAYLIVPPIEAFSKNYFIASCNSNFTFNYVTIVVESSRASELLLNNKKFLSSLQPRPIPGTPLNAYQVLLPCSGVAESFRIVHPDPTVTFSATAYGYGPFISYAYTAGRAVKKFTITQALVNGTAESIANITAALPQTRR